MDSPRHWRHFLFVCCSNSFLRLLLLVYSIGIYDAGARRSAICIRKLNDRSRLRPFAIQVGFTFAQERPVAAVKRQLDVGRQAAMSQMCHRSDI